SAARSPRRISASEGVAPSSSTAVAQALREGHAGEPALVFGELDGPRRAGAMKSPEEIAERGRTEAAGQVHGGPWWPGQGRRGQVLGAARLEDRRFGPFRRGKRGPGGWSSGRSGRGDAASGYSSQPPAVRSAAASFTTRRAFSTSGRTWSTPYANAES